MPLYDYTLEVTGTGGGSGSFDDFHVVDGTCILTAGGGGDRLSLVLEFDARQASPILPHAGVKLFYKGTPVWQGVALGSTWSAGPGSSLSHRLTIDCVGPTIYLASQPFLQVWHLQTDPTHPELGATYELPTSSTIVGGPTGSLSDIISQSITQVAAAGFPVSTVLTNIPNFTPASERLVDVSCLEVIERMQGWMPGVQCRWNYAATEGAELQWYSVLRPDNLLGLPASQLDTRNTQLTSMYQWSASKRIDQLVSNYSITYLRRKRVFTGVGITIVMEGQTDSATAANGSPIKKASAIKVNGITWNGATFEDGEAFPANGLAKMLLAPFADVYYDLNFRTEIDWSWVPLQLVSVTDAAPGLDSAWANVRSVTHSLRDDLTSVQAGTPTGINPSRAITRPARTRREDGGESNSQTYGFEPHNEPTHAGDVSRKFLTNTGFVDLSFPFTRGNNVVDPLIPPEVDNQVVVWNSGVPDFETQSGVGGLPGAPPTDGIYQLILTLVEGTPTYSWYGPLTENLRPVCTAEGPFKGNLLFKDWAEWE